MKRKTSRRMLRVLALVLAVLVVGSGVYLSRYYHADSRAQAALAQPPEGVAIQTLEGGALAFVPAQPEAGLIFYPGGKVETESYAPLLTACARRGILCVLADFPFRLAVFDPDAAGDLMGQFPQITRWYVGGHSLGGVMAARYAGAHPAELEGLVLLASYSTADLTDSGLRVLSVLGSEDRVLNREKYNQAKPLLPADTRELVIDGGCHALFGDYGPQAGDGTPTISAEEQQALTADAVWALVKQGSD